LSEIKTARLILRRARLADLDDFHEILSNPVATRYWSTPPHQILDETREWLGNMIAAPLEGSDDYVVEHEGRLIGKAGCYRLPEIGFIFRPEIWARGFAREALETIIPRIFAAHPVAALTADVDPRNLASLGLLARLGFRETGRAKATWTVGGEVSDSAYLALPRPGA